jgi:hypothetical protein
MPVFSCSRPASFFLIYAAQMIPFLLVENHPYMVGFQPLNLLSVLPETPVVPLTDARQTEELRKKYLPSVP